MLLTLLLLELDEQLALRLTTDGEAEAAAASTESFLTNALEPLSKITGLFLEVSR